MKNVLVHLIADDSLMNDMNVATKTIPQPVILARLKAAGRVPADSFIEICHKDIELKCTVDLNGMFIGLEA